MVEKVLNNNVIIAKHPEYDEIVVIGKGIGFNRKSKDVIPMEAVEKMFILTNKEERDQYKQLVPHINEQLIEVMNEAILYISQQCKEPLNEHIHVALTDHIAFAIKRLEQGLAIHNPFLFETKEIYPMEYEMAKHVVQMIKERMGVDLGEDEIGFVALHIYSAMTNQHITEIQEYSRLIADLVKIIEEKLGSPIPRDSLDFSRLLTHLRFAIERIRRGEKVKEATGLDRLLHQEYPEMYSLAWKLTKVMEQRLHKPVYQAEVSYLTVHLHRVAQKNE
nr:PRD domain-containing protein [Paenibacillus sediminis]